MAHDAIEISDSPEQHDNMFARHIFANRNKFSGARIDNIGVLTDMAFQYVYPAMYVEAARIREVEIFVKRMNKYLSRHKMKSLHIDPKVVSYGPRASDF